MELKRVVLKLNRNISNISLNTKLNEINNFIFSNYFTMNIDTKCYIIKSNIIESSIVIDKNYKIYHKITNYD